MSLKGACVDFARIIRLEPSTVRVEGRSTFEPVPEQWFRCRLTVSDGGRKGQSVPRSQSAMDFRARMLMGELLMVTVDLDGNPLDLRSDQRLDVSSQQLGRAIWRPETEPQPVRKKRRLIGYTVNCERVVERMYDDLLLQGVPVVALTPAVPKAHA